MELKKNPKLDYRKKSGLFFNIGLVVSLSLVISAFEWKFTDQVVKVYKPVSSFEVDELSPPITEINPPKPKVQVFKLIEVKDDEIIEDPKIEIVIVTGEDEVPDIPEVIFEEATEEAEEIHIIVESMPSFKGGMSEFYKFVSKNLIYPAQARRMGIEGKVYVYFVVDNDGSLSDIEVVKGIGAGCDEEVLRITKMCPNWNPGKQRGEPVRVRMMMPITFRLN